MAIFKGEPNLFVRFNNKNVQRITNSKGLHFDCNGEYETDKPFIINMLKQHFEEIPVEKTFEETLNRSFNGKEKRC